MGKLRGEVITALLIVVRGDVAHGHLAASSEEGYKLHASYGLHWVTLRYLMERGVRYFDVGTAAGNVVDEHGGLARFKKGWSNDSRSVYLCGGIFDSAKYSELTARRISGTDYFPAYRSGEFG